MPKIKAVVLFLDPALSPEELDEAAAQIRGHAHPAVKTSEVRYHGDKNVWCRLWSQEEVDTFFSGRREVMTQ